MKRRRRSPRQEGHVVVCYTLVIPRVTYERVKARAAKLDISTRQLLHAALVRGIIATQGRYE